MHPRVMGIQVCSNEGHCPNSKGRKLRNNENTSAKFKNFLLQNQWANFNQIHAIMHPWMKGIQIFQMDTNNIENTLTKFKKLLQKLWANLNIWIWHKASLGDGNSSLFIWRSIQFSWSSSGFFLLLINVSLWIWNVSQVSDGAHGSLFVVVVVVVFARSFFLYFVLRYSTSVLFNQKLPFSSQTSQIVSCMIWISYTQTTVLSPRASSNQSLFDVRFVKNARTRWTNQISADKFNWMRKGQRVHATV